MVAPDVSERNSVHEVMRLKHTGIFPIASFLRTESLDRGLFIPMKDLIYTPLFGPYTESYLLTQAVRQTAFDDTGIVPHLLGVAHNPEETLMYMMPAATEALSWLKAQGGEIAKETLDALFHNGPCSMNSLSNLDQMWGSIVKKIKDTAFNTGLAEYGGRMTTEARMFREENSRSLKTLRERHSLKDLVSRCLVPDGGGSFLINVTEGLTGPTVPKMQVAKLSEILPDMFNRNIDTPREQLNLEARILKELGKVGNDFTRILIRMMKDNQHTQRMSTHLA